MRNGSGAQNIWGTQLAYLRPTPYSLHPMPTIICAFNTRLRKYMATNSKELGSTLIFYGRKEGIIMDLVQPLSTQQSYDTTVIHYGREVLYIKFINVRERRNRGRSTPYPKTYT